MAKHEREPDLGIRRLYLIRHAHALDGADDAARPLSRRGRDQVRALAEFLGKSDALRPAEIWHSPLVRARETAELLAKRLRLAAPLRAITGLEPGAEPRRIAQRIGRLRQAVAIVGHEPHLSALASLLVAGAAEPPVFVFKKCAVLALDCAGSRWVVRWQVAPELLA